MPRRDPRPVFLDLTRIRLPVGALTSIAHRIAGMVMALGLPLIIYLFVLSLQDANGYRMVTNLLAHPAAQVGVVVLTWAFAHHLLAGLRVMMIDMEVGVAHTEARRSAWITNLGGLFLAAMVAGWLW